MQNTAPVYLPAGAPLKLTYSYGGNSSGFGGDNFAADLVSPTDDISLANDIAVSGARTTRLYPDMSFGGSHAYHLEVQFADSSAFWSVTITEKLLP